LALGLFRLPAGRAASGSPALQDAVVALQHKDYKGAEQKLRTEVKLHPGDAETLSLLGVALGGQKRFAEANEAHKRAVAIAPGSPEVLDNYANNLLAMGDDKGAQEAFLKAVSLNPAEHNANLQLAQLALNRKDGRGALVYLDHLKNESDSAILRLVALDFAGDGTRAGALFERLAAATQTDGNLSAEDGWTLARAGQFDQAETFLAHALAADPANFQILFSLGVTASKAGHDERARNVLDTALRQQPKNVDALYALAFVYIKLKQQELAIPLLADAARLASQRPDVQKLLAIATGDIGAQEDSIAAWERYMRLAPGDDTARRERGFEKAQVGMFDEAISDLEWFVARHPDDEVGFYELGVAQGANDPTQGLSNLDRAIALKPDFVAARLARGKLLSLQGRPEAALPDLEFAVDQPSVQASERAAALDRLGQVYLTLDRLADAIPVLRKAAELAPDDSTTMLHLANALAEAGQTDESDALMARFRQMRPGGMAPPVRGLMDYLSLTPEKRHEDYRSRLSAIMRDHPDDKTAQLLYLKSLLGDNQMAKATADARSFAALRPGANWLADLGHALLEAKQYSAATEILEQATATDPSASLDPSLAASLNLDLAIAALHTPGSASATTATERLRQLDRVPESGRGDDYYLVRAQLLDAANKPDDAVTTMDQALHAAPKRPDLYWQAAVFLAGYHRAPEALALLDRAAQILPDEASIPIIRATVMELAGKSDDAQRLLNDIQRRWPEVSAVWVTRGMIQATHHHFDEARRALETAVALGARSPEVWCALADSTLRSVPVRIDAAEAAISEALKLAPDDPHARALAGRIAAQKSDPRPVTKPESAGAHDEDTVSMKLFLTRPPRDW
jgi:tetratricopeptide (TPR) repeat protein